MSATKETDFSSQPYWQSRFVSNPAPFDWLSPPASLVPIISQILSQLHGHTTANNNNTASVHPPRVFHIGCGTSLLSLFLRSLLNSNQASQILNVDYAPSAIAVTSRREKESFGDIKMQYATLNLLNWAFIETGIGSFEKFQLVVDKSCIDAVACGQDVILDARFGGDTVYPTVALALYLAAVIELGAYWVTMSYSQSRFEFLSSEEKVRGLWIVEEEEKMVIEEARSDGTVFRSEVSNYIYILKRSQVPVQFTMNDRSPCIAHPFLQRAGNS